MDDSVSLKHKQTWQSKESENTVEKKKVETYSLWATQDFECDFSSLYLSFCAHELSWKQHS